MGPQFLVGYSDLVAGLPADEILDRPPVLLGLELAPYRGRLVEAALVRFLNQYLLVDEVLQVVEIAVDALLRRLALIGQAVDELRHFRGGDRGVADVSEHQIGIAATAGGDSEEG